MKIAMKGRRYRIQAVVLKLKLHKSISIGINAKSVSKTIDTSFKKKDKLHGRIDDVHSIFNGAGALLNY